MSDVDDKDVALAIEGSLQPTWRRNLTGICKVGLSIGAVLFIARSVDFTQALKAVSRLSLFEVAAATLLLSASVLLIAPRWGAIMATESNSIPARHLIGPIYAGFLINQALPTAIGGDAYRIWAVHRKGVALLQAVSSVLVDRIMGIIAALALFAFGSTALLAQGSYVPPVALFLASIALTSITALLVVYIVPNVSVGWLEKLIRPMRSLSGAVHKALWLSKQSPKICVLSILTQLIPVAALWIIIVGLGLSVSPETCLILGPATMIAAAIPLSFGGWGIREAALVFILRDFGVPLTEAFVVSVVFGSLTIMAALPGALVLSLKWSDP